MGAWRREGGAAPKRVGFGGPVERTDDLHLLRKSRPGSCECATSEAMGRSEPPMASAARRRTMNGVATGDRAGVPRGVPRTFGGLNPPRACYSPAHPARRHGNTPGGPNHAVARSPRTWAAVRRGAGRAPGLLGMGQQGSEGASRGGASRSHHLSTGSSRQRWRDDRGAPWPLRGLGARFSRRFPLVFAPALVSGV